MRWLQQSINAMLLLWWAIIGEVVDANPINPSRPGDMSDAGQQALYLEQFGYMANSGAQVTEDVLSEALRKFQQKWGLQETGQMNEETKNLMETPRCGCPDIPNNSSDRRRKRYAIHRFGGWSRTDLTYKIVNASSTLSVATSNDALRRALAEWSNVTPLIFTETSDEADLTIFFVSGNHEDGYGFDGPSGVLAHAFFPAYGGDAHFDADELWTIEAGGAGIDLFLVGVHEFGHSLGLGHSDVGDAIMYPFYSYKPSFSMPLDDKNGIRAIYGSNENPTSAPPATERLTAAPTTAAPTTAAPAPDACAFCNLDAITSDKSGNIFIFHGEAYTLIDHNGVVDGYPRQISTDFPEIEGSVDAVIYLPAIVRDKCVTKNGILRCYVMQRPEEVYLFSGTNYQRYTSGYLESRKKRNSGRISSKFIGIPSNTTLDAAFTYDGIDIYLVSGDSVWKQRRWRKEVESGYPKLVSEDLVSNLPTPIQDVLSVPTTSTYHNYFFQNSVYYRTTNGASVIDSQGEAYPRSIRNWWCKNNVQNDLGFQKHHTIYIEKNFNRIEVLSNTEL